ncbi:MAG TPA: MFS transporter, partial [Candidatus Hydrogenedentes bacterium]|nr:MFS transporter [Candidatus Hydrogenedentota bacterium]
AWLAQRIGRKPSFAFSFIACAIVVPLTFHITDSMTTALIMFPLMGFFTTSLFGGYAVYFPELFPTRLRATGVGFCYNVARYIAILGPSLFGVLRADLGIAWAATVVSSVFLLGLFMLPFAPETRGKPLPE